MTWNYKDVTTAAYRDATEIANTATQTFADAEKTYRTLVLSETEYTLAMRTYQEACEAWEEARATFRNSPWVKW